MDAKWGDYGLIQKSAGKTRANRYRAATPYPSVKPTDAATAERRKLAELVGTRENASLLFQSKVVGEDVVWAGGVLLQRLDFVNGVNSVYTNFDHMSDTDVTDWGTRCWANTVAHLCEGDTEVRTAVTIHRSILPDDPTAAQLIMGKVHAAFRFFLWALASPTQPLSLENCCCIKFILLSDVILLENIHAKRDGAFGGWGLLDKTIAGLRDVAQGFGISRIKAVATNERVYGAFLRRGFHDQDQVEGLPHYVENYSKPVELRWQP
jgi:hypothetical protein